MFVTNRASGHTHTALCAFPDSKVNGANMGPMGPGGPHVGPMNFANWVGICTL